MCLITSGGVRSQNTITSFHAVNDVIAGYSIVPESSLMLLALASAEYEEEINKEFDAIGDERKSHILSEKSGAIKGRVFGDIFPRLLSTQLIK